MTVRWNPPPVPPNPPIVIITPRQADVLALVCLGWGNDEIAERLFVTPNTVRSHAKRMFHAMGVRNRTEAAVVASTGRLEIYVR